MASKVLVPAAPFAKLQVKKSPPESASAGAGFIIGGDAAARVTHLEHSVRFLQEQHRLMLSGLHAEIEALRERNRDLQFQLIFNKESSPKPTSTNTDENAETEEAKLKREVSRLEKEATTARSEARAAEARALQLQRLVDTQTEKLRVLELSTKCTACVEGVERREEGGAGEAGQGEETRAELRARLAEAERLVRRLRGDAERRRREVPDLGRGPTSVTNLLFDGAANTHAHLQCMKNSLHASLRATGLDGYGFHNKYHFPPAPPPVHTPDFWREPIREDYNLGGRGRSTRRPLTLPELAGQPMHRSTVYANNHTRPRANGYDKNKKSQPSNGEVANGKSPEEQPESRIYTNFSKPLSNVKDKPDMNSNVTYPELKIVVTKMIPYGNVSNGNGQTSQPSEAGARARPRRHRKHVDHT